MQNESETSLEKQQIYKHFSCPECGGRILKGIVEFDANINSLDDEGAYFTVNGAMEPDIALFYCPECNWDTDKQSSVMDYMK